MEKKIEIIKKSYNKKLIAGCIGINHKNIYYKSLQEEKDQVVKEQIEETFKTHPAYGHKRMSLELGMNKKRVLRVMHKYNLKAPRLWYSKKFTTQSDPGYQIRYRNVLQDNDWDTYTIGDVWSSDLTYIKYQGVFYYLAIIQDIVSKEVVGFQVSDKHDAELILKTIKSAMVHTKTTPRIFHSDRGREYLSTHCTAFLESMNVAISVSDPGSPWQNAWSESFFSRFKQESGDMSRFTSLGELIEYIFGYISYYNNKRIHSTIKMTPYQYKQNYSESVLEKWGT